MLARIVENWLTSAGERGYQTAFAQLLSAEGRRILHSPVHHPFEHGKDLIAYNRDGLLEAYQLKGGDISLTELAAMQGQLFALAGAAVTYPGVEPPRRPDRVFLVTSGELSTPARDRLHVLNEGRSEGFPVIEVIERPQLVGRFVGAHEQYLPEEPKDFNDFLMFILGDGSGPFPVQKLASFLDGITSKAASGGSGTALRRAIASAVLLTAYSSGSWQKLGNHLEVARAWLTLAIHILAVAADRGFGEVFWRESFELARDSARAELKELLNEAHARSDLVIPNVVEGIVYPSRAALVCGFLGGFLISERELDAEQEIADKVRSVLARELPHAKAVGEASAPLLLVAATALDVLGEHVEAAKIITLYSVALTRANQPDSKDAVADPYHPIEEVLLSSIGEDTSVNEEEFHGEAYTLHIAIDWLARRGLRPIIERIWPDATRIHFCETRPSEAAGLLLLSDDKAEHVTWAPPMPQSWKQLHETAQVVQEASLPAELWRDTWLLAYLPLVFPHRLTAAVAKAIDYVALQNVRVELAAEDPGSDAAETIQVPSQE